MTEQGTVKFFDVEKRYGFIAPDYGSRDVFVHLTGIASGCLTKMVPGQKVRFDLETDERNRLIATNVSPVSQ